MHRPLVLRLVAPPTRERGAKVIALRSRRAARLERRAPKHRHGTRPDAAWFEHYDRRKHELEALRES